MSAAGLLLALMLVSSQGDAKSADNTQQKCIAQAVYMESRNQPLKGQIAVRDVIRNRARKLNKRPCNVVFAKNQFEWVAKKKPPRVELSEYKEVMVSKPVLPGDYMYFFRKDMPRPPWSKGMSCKVVIADHRFCRETN